MDFIVNSKNFIWEFFNQLSGNVYGWLLGVIDQMVTLLRKFPQIKDVPEIYIVWQYMLYLSLTCTALILVYIGTKYLLTTELHSIVRSLEAKTVIVRFMYMLIFVLGSMAFVDWIIVFNNTLIDVLVTRFDIKQSINLMVSKPSTNVIMALLVMYQIYLSIHIIIGYWLRVAEVITLLVLSPSLFVLWVNPAWGSYLSNWVYRVTTLIMTQFIQVLILVIYGQIVFRFVETGSLSGICLAVATLRLMKDTPSLLKNLIAQDNAGKIVGDTWNNIKGMPRKYNTAKTIVKKFIP